MKKAGIKTILAVVVALFIATSGFSQSGTTGSVTWTLDDSGTLTISGTGAMDDYKLLSSPPWYGSKDDIRKVVIAEGVANIGSYAFYRCTSMESVSISPTVKSIGSCAFYDCSSLTEAYIPNSVTEIGKDVFYKCSSLTTLSLGSSVGKIGGSLIYECDNLERLICNSSTPPEITTKFMNETFLGAPTGTCTVLVPDGSEGAYKALKGWKSFKNFDKIKGNIAQVQQAGGTSAPVQATATSGVAKESSGVDGTISWKINDKSELYISGSGRMESYTPIVSNNQKPPWFSRDDNAKVPIGESKMMCYVNKVFIADIENIGAFAFSGCKQLSYVSIPNTVTSIDAQAFSLCESLKAIEIPNSVTNIGVNAFQRSGLKYVVIPSSVTQIEGKAFYGSALDSIALPNTIDNIGGETFAYCQNLLTITVPASVINIHQNAFFKCTNLKTVVIEKSDKTKYIRKEAFKGCTALTSVSLPASKIDVADHAFEDCTGLTSIEIPNTMTAIWVGTFKNTGLKSIVLPASIGMIADSAFDGCKNLESVTILNPKPPTIGSWAVFRGISPNCVLYVPKASLSLYKAPNYSKWFKEVVGI